MPKGRWLSVSEVGGIRKRKFMFLSKPFRRANLSNSKKLQNNSAGEGIFISLHQLRWSPSL